MSQDNNETISRLMDGDVQQDSLFGDVSKDQEAVETWQRYHLIRDSLQNNLSENIDLDLHKRVMADLENEPVVLAPKRKKASQYTKPLAGFAIAASVMAAVLIGVQTGNVEQQGSPELVASTQTPITPNNQFNQPIINQDSIRTVSNSANVARSANSISEATLNRYLINYNELRANRGVQGMVPYVRIVGYEEE